MRRRNFSKIQDCQINLWICFPFFTIVQMFLSPPKDENVLCSRSQLDAINFYRMLFPLFFRLFAEETGLLILWQFSCHQYSNFPSIDSWLFICKLCHIRVFSLLTFNDIWYDCWHKNPGSLRRRRWVGSWRRRRLRLSCRQLSEDFRFPRLVRRRRRRRRRC